MCMWWVLALILAAGVIAAVVWVRGRVDDPVQPHGTPRDAGCCGQHAVCERDSLLAAVSSRVEYYDDEELDHYRGRAADAYDDAEAEEFRSVLYTMRDDDVPGWCRSLQLRGIELPDQLRDEVVLIVGEDRAARTHK